MGKSSHEKPARLEHARRQRLVVPLQMALQYEIEQQRIYAGQFLM
jgi:hypothetical protein